MYLRKTDKHVFVFISFNVAGFIEDFYRLTEIHKYFSVAFIFLLEERKVLTLRVSTAKQACEKADRHHFCQSRKKSTLFTSFANLADVTTIMILHNFLNLFNLSFKSMQDIFFLILTRALLIRSKFSAIIFFRRRSEKFFSDFHEWVVKKKNFMNETFLRNFYLTPPSFFNSCIDSAQYLKIIIFENFLLKTF